MPPEFLDGRIERVLRAGERLIAALKEEERMAGMVCKAPEDDAVYGDWARARRAIELCQLEYAGALRDCGAAQDGAGGDLVPFR
jgi:hypothetical protein